MESEERSSIDSFHTHIVQHPLDALQILVPTVLYLVQNSLLHVRGAQQLTCRPQSFRSPTVSGKACDNSYCQCPTAPAPVLSTTPVDLPSLLYPSVWRLSSWGNKRMRKIAPHKNKQQQHCNNHNSAEYPEFTPGCSNPQGIEKSIGRLTFESYSHTFRHMGISGGH
jgi:hypothetical protein